MAGERRLQLGPRRRTVAMRDFRQRQAALPRVGLQRVRPRPVHRSAERDEPEHDCIHITRDHDICPDRAGEGRVVARQLTEQLAPCLVAGKR